MNQAGNITRRTLLGAVMGAPAVAQRRPQRVVVLMFDGFGIDYWRRSPIPVLHGWAKSGIFRQTTGVMPSVTNANNASICCGCWPYEHGITGNSYLDEATGQEEYMENSKLLLAPTLFEHAAKNGVKSALLSSKRKTTALLDRGVDFTLTPEAPVREWTELLGPAPDIYSSAVNHWLLRAAVHVLKTRPDIGCLYIHTTDYPMHTWSPDEAESKDHLTKLDALIGEAAAAAPDAAFLMTADHGLNHKKECWDLARACATRGTPIRIAISAERDKYLKHHRGFGGTAWVYLKSPQDETRVAETIMKLRGVHRVLTRAEARQQFKLLPSRIGDLVVTGGAYTVFGELDREHEILPTSYRSHGSAAETQIPLLVHNATEAPAWDYFQSNLDLARWLYRRDHGLNRSESAPESGPGPRY